MARIQGVSKKKAGLMARFAYWYAKRSFGKVPEPIDDSNRRSVRPSLPHAACAHA